MSTPTSGSPPMIAKLITVHIKPGHLDDYLAAQRVWNIEMARSAGYIGGFCGQAGPHIVKMTLLWASRAAYETWMATDHDRIAQLAGAKQFYEWIETEIIEQVLPSDLTSGACRTD